MKNIYLFSKGLITNYFISKNSTRYNFKQKIQIYRALIVLDFYSKFFKSKAEVSVRLLNFKVVAYSYNNILYLFKELFLTNEYFFLTSTQEPTIIDCGSNIGMSVLYFKYIYPNSQIIAFEPNPAAFQLLKKNVELNGLKNVELNNVGLADAKGKLDFYNGGLGNDLLIASLNPERGGKNHIIIETQKLSTYIGRNMIDLIKIDVEGAENLILKDLQESNKLNFFKNIIIEYHHGLENSPSTLSAFLKIFEENDFKYNLKSNYQDLQDFQDILLNFYKKEYLN